uniref:hypothetical protein n=1 Tax=Caballeronia sp. GAFFF3 TaxID=2921759 RepID=UPI002027B070
VYDYINNTFQQCPQQLIYIGSGSSSGLSAGLKTSQGDIFSYLQTIKDETTNITPLSNVLSLQLPNLSASTQNGLTEEFSSSLLNQVPVLLPFIS